MKSEYGRCIVCGRRVKNRIFYRGMLIYICPRHVKGMKEKELHKYLDEIVKGEKSSGLLYQDILKSLSMINSKISTLGDKLDTYMNIFSQKRLDEYKSYKDFQKIISKLDSILNTLNNFDRECDDELSFLNNLVKEYSELHYHVEDGVITVYLERNIEFKRFRELDNKLRSRGYAYNKRVHKWIKTVS